MKYQQWLWQSSIAALLGVALANSVAAQDNLSDSTGHNTSNAPFVTIGSGGDTANALSRIRRRAYNPATGEISFNFQGINGIYSIDPRITVNGELGGNAGLEGNDALSDDSAQCTGELCQESVAGETQEITLNEIAELLEIDLDRSLERLALAEEAVEKVASEPRRIVRRSTQRECINPYIRARDEVDRKLEQARDFIEQVEPINPENGLW